MATPTVKGLDEVVVGAVGLAKHASSAGDGPGNSTITTATKSAVEESLRDSVYALAVKQVVKSGWKSRTWRLVGALCFTILLQLALIELLWQVSTCSGGTAASLCLSLLRLCLHLHLPCCRRSALGESM